jgi:type I restriction enzyme M protein
MNIQSSTIVKRVWNYCNVLRDDGIFYGNYVESALEKALVRALRLRQAVPFGDDMLKPAFEGRLR